MDMIDLDNIQDDNISDENIDDLLKIYNVQDDDLIIVNNDGSYVIVPMDLAEQLMSDNEFSHKVDVGFEDIHDFQTYVEKILKKQ